MTGLERRVSEQTESHPILRRYLTPFYGFTLGLALILAIVAIILRPIPAPQGVDSPPVTPAQTVIPGGGNNQAIGNSTPTPPASVPSTPDENIPSPLGVAVAELNGLQVTMWYPWSGPTGAVFQALLDEFNRSNSWGIKVNGNSFEGYGRLDEAVESALNTNPPPDAPSPLPDVIVDYGYAARHWDNNQALLDLTPYVNDPIWGLTSEEQADFFQGFWEEDLIPDGGTATVRRLGIPFYRSAYVIFYNQGWASELGYSAPPAKPEEFREQACAAADYLARQEGKSEPRRGGYLVTSQGGAMAGWIYAFAGNITDPGMEKYLFNTPETASALQFLKDLQESGCAWAETGINPHSEFASRHALFMVGSLYDMAAQEQAFTQASSSDKWAVIPFPSHHQPVVDTYGPSLFINRSSPAEQLAAWLVIKWLVEPTHQVRWSEVLQVYPVRLSAMDQLSRASNPNPQWAGALDLLPDAHAEPNLVSWSMMRWVLEDAMTQLFDPQFDGAQIPDMLTNLDSVAAEILSQVH